MFFDEFIKEFCSNVTVLEDIYNVIAEIFTAYPVFSQIIMAGIIGGFFKGIYKWLIRGLKRFLKPRKKSPLNSTINLKNHQILPINKTDNNTK